MDEIIKEFNHSQQHLISSAKQMKSMVIDWANVNSGSYHLSGLVKMHSILAKAFSILDAEINSHESNAFEIIDEKSNLSLQKTGNILTIKKRWQSEKRILLCGHMDTVFGKDHAFQKVTEPQNGYLNGPGVADMKGGLVVILHALMAFEKTSFAEKLGWQVVINADEEIGSLGSSEFLDKCADEAPIALVYEPSMSANGMFAGSRKGSGKFSIIVEGVSAHAGRAFYEGRNAICHLSKLIVEMEKLNDPKHSLTVNVGLISGGTALNSVPDRAIAKIDVRFINDIERVNFETDLKIIIQKYI